MERENPETRDKKKQTDIESTLVSSEQFEVQHFSSDQQDQGEKICQPFTSGDSLGVIPMWLSKKKITCR